MSYAGVTVGSRCGDMLVAVRDILYLIALAKCVKHSDNGMTAENNPRFASQFAYEMEAMTARIYRIAIEEGKKTGDVRPDIDSAFAAFLLDNIFMSLQFSYACDYYKERFRIYAGNDITERDDFVVEQCLKFVKSALKK